MGRYLRWGWPPVRLETPLPAGLEVASPLPRGDQQRNRRHRRHRRIEPGQE